MEELISLHVDLDIETPIKKFQLYLTPKIKRIVEGNQVTVRYLEFYGEPHSIGDDKKPRHWYAAVVDSWDYATLMRRISDMQAHHTVAGHDIRKVDWNIQELVERKK
jgi:hypothetical protein